ncbi:MAG TPA: RNA polymerase sigma factor [Pedomonas sp.]|uniref:RNA polymerase sigma factor n=1 Tax=Pedomonas sp. TaxID=2976421 RepID=UPI002F403DB3
MTDAPCVGLSSVRQRDRSPLDDMYRNHKRDAVLFIRRRCARTGIDPEDIVQSAFERLAARQHVQSSAGIRKERNFLLMTALNILRDQVRQSRTQAYMAHHLDLVGPFETIEELTPEAVVAGRRSLEILDKALSGLPAARRQMFLDSQLEEKTIRDVAAKFNVPRTTVHDIVTAALRSCSRALNPPSDDFSRS